MNKLIYVLVIGFLLAYFSSATKTYAQTNAIDIVNKANIAAYYQADDGKALVKMTITDSQGRTREREFVILRKDENDGGDQFYYVYFNSPSDVRRMVFMVKKHPGKDDDRWLYLPALDLVKRIAASDKRSSFVGSDFLYEDVSGRNTEDDKHELLKEDDDFFIIKNLPNDPDSVEFNYYTIWIDKKTFLPKKAEYFNKNDTLYRTVEALLIENIGGLPTIKKSKVTNLDTGSNTVLEFYDVKYNIGLKDNIFSERFLRRPPREVRK